MSTGDCPAFSIFHTFSARSLVTTRLGAYIISAQLLRNIALERKSIRRLSGVVPAEAPDTVILNLAWQQRNFHEGNRLPVLLNPNPGHERIKRFCSLFAGRTDVWGALHGQAVKELVTPAHYDLHLQGRVSLGIYPLAPSGVVR